MNTITNNTNTDDDTLVIRKSEVTRVVDELQKQMFIMTGNALAINCLRDSFWEGMKVCILAEEDHLHCAMLDGAGALVQGITEEAEKDTFKENMVFLATGIFPREEAELESLQKHTGWEVLYSPEPIESNNMLALIVPKDSGEDYLSVAETLQHWSDELCEGFSIDVNLELDQNDEQHSGRVCLDRLENIDVNYFLDRRKNIVK